MSLTYTASELIPVPVSSQQIFRVFKWSLWFKSHYIWMFLLIEWRFLNSNHILLFKILPDVYWAKLRANKKRWWKGIRSWSPPGGCEPFTSLMCYNLVCWSQGFSWFFFFPMEFENLLGWFTWIKIFIFGACETCQLWICTNLGLNAGSLFSYTDEDNRHYVSWNNFSAVMSGNSLKRKRGSNHVILLLLTLKVQHGHWLFIAPLWFMTRIQLA